MLASKVFEEKSWGYSGINSRISVLLRYCFLEAGRIALFFNSSLEWGEGVPATFETPKNFFFRGKARIGGVT